MGQIEDIADELRYRIRAQLDGLEELRAIGSDYISKESLLVAEMRVQTFFTGAGGSGYAVNARSGEAMLGEFRAGRGKDFVSELRRRSHSIIIAKQTRSFVTMGDRTVREAQKARITWPQPMYSTKR